jgi:hypothetical protein
MTNLMLKCSIFCNPYMFWCVCFLCWSDDYHIFYWQHLKHKAFIVNEQRVFVVAALLRISAHLTYSVQDSQRWNSYEGCQHWGMACCWALDDWRFSHLDKCASQHCKLRIIRDNEAHRSPSRWPPIQHTSLLMDHWKRHCINCWHRVKHSESVSWVLDCGVRQPWPKS